MILTKRFGIVAVVFLIFASTFSCEEEWQDEFEEEEYEELKELGVVQQAAMMSSSSKRRPRGPLKFNPPNKFYPRCQLRLHSNMISNGVSISPYGTFVKHIKTDPGSHGLYIRVDRVDQYPYPVTVEMNIDGESVPGMVEIDDNEFHPKSRIMNSGDMDAAFHVIFHEPGNTIISPRTDKPCNIHWDNPPHPSDPDYFFFQVKGTIDLVPVGQVETGNHHNLKLKTGDKVTFTLRASPRPSNGKVYLREYSTYNGMAASNYIDFPAVVDLPANSEYATFEVEAVTHNDWTFWEKHNGRWILTTYAGHNAHTELAAEAGYFYKEHRWVFDIRPKDPASYSNPDPDPDPDPEPEPNTNQVYSFTLSKGTGYSWFNYASKTISDLCSGGTAILKKVKWNNVGIQGTNNQNPSFSLSKSGFTSLLAPGVETTVNGQIPMAGAYSGQINNVTESAAPIAASFTMTYQCH